MESVGMSASTNGAGGELLRGGENVSIRARAREAPSYFGFFFIALLILGFLPLSNLGHSAGKSVYVFVLTGLLGAALGGALFFLPRIRARRGVLALGFFAPLGAALLSSLIRGFPLSEFAGLSFEPDSIAAFFVFAVWGVSFLVLAREERARLFADILAALLILLAFVQGGAGFSVFLREHPLLGDPLSQAIATAALLLVVVARFFFAPPPRWRQPFSAFAVLIAALSFTSVVFPSLTISAAAAVAVVPFLTLLTPRMGSAKEGNVVAKKGRLSLIFLVAASLLIIGFFGGRISDLIGLAKPSGELRLSPAATAHIIAGAYRDDPLSAFIGVGPGHFSYAWNMYRPLGVNAGPLWNADHVSSFSFLTTLAATVGAPAALLVLLLLFLFALALIRRVRSPDPSAAALPAGLGAFFMLVWLLFYFPSSAYLALAAALAGVFLGLTCAALEGSAAPAHEKSPALHTALFLCAAILIVLGGVSVWRGILRASALALYGESVRALKGSDDAEQAANILRRSIAIERLPIAERSLSFLDREAVRAIVGDSSGQTGGGNPRSRALALLTEGKDVAARASARDPRDFRNHLEWGSVTTVAALIARDGEAAEEAIVHYNAAITSARAHPLPYLAKAQALVLFGRGEEALPHLRESLRLKPDYAQARNLLRSLERL